MNDRRALIDGHNAMFLLRIEAPTHEEARHELLHRVRARDPEATVIFDGRAAPSHLSQPAREKGVRVHYCKHHEADEEIIQRVTDAERPERLLVVSDDRELTGRARQLGALTKSVRGFFGRDSEPAGDPMDDAPWAPRRRKLRVLPDSEVKPSPGRSLNDDERPLTPADFGLPDEVDLNKPLD